MSDVVRPETITLPLSEGRSLTVIKELNAGEWTDMIEALAERRKFARIIAYAVGWTLVGLDGQPLPYHLGMSEQERRDTIRSISSRRLREIYAVLDKHEAAEEAAVEAKKKTAATAPESSAPSPSDALPG